MMILMTKQFLRFICLLSISIFIGIETSQAQDLKNLQVNQLSDQQMMQVWQQFSARGMTESEAMKTMVQKGFSPNQVGAFKKRLLSIQDMQKSKFGANGLIKDTSMFLHDSSWVVEVPNVHLSSKYYGYDFFSNPAANFNRILI